MAFCSQPNQIKIVFQSGPTNEVQLSFPKPSEERQSRAHQIHKWALIVTHCVFETTKIVSKSPFYNYN